MKNKRNNDEEDTYSSIEGLRLNSVDDTFELLHPTLVKLETI